MWPGNATIINHRKKTLHCDGSWNGTAFFFVDATPNSTQTRLAITFVLCTSSFPYPPKWLLLWHISHFGLFHNLSPNFWYIPLTCSTSKPMYILNIGLMYMWFHFSKWPPIWLLQLLVGAQHVLSYHSFQRYFFSVTSGVDWCDFSLNSDLHLTV